MCKIISFGSLKGGTGKTTSALSAAGILSERGKRVLLIDIDPRANVTWNLGFDINQLNLSGIEQIIMNEDIWPERVVIKSFLSELPSLDLIPSSQELMGALGNIIGITGRELILKNYFFRYKEFFFNYDFIIFDCSSNFSIIDQNAYIISDAIIIMTDVGTNGIRGYKFFHSLLEDMQKRLGINCSIKGILINKFNENSALSREFTEYCCEEEEIKGLLFESLIPYDEIILESELDRKVINLLDKNSSVCNEYGKFVDELISRI